MDELPFETINTDVCIIGSGPAGIVLGHILLQHGIRCIVLDKYDRQQIYARGRAGLLDARTVAILKHYHIDAGLEHHGVRHDRCEFRTPQYSFVLNYGELCEGNAHYVYPQNDLVDDLIDLFVKKGGQLYFNHDVHSIEASDNPVVKCHDTANKRSIKIECQLIAGCDGYHGIARRTVPPDLVQIFEKEHIYSWLAILAEAPPSTEHIIYSLHARGFAGHMLRNEEISRYYLQISANDTLESWNDKRVWNELTIRLAKQGWTLNQGRIIEKSILSMRSYVMEPMHYNTLFLAGDAAHIITPCGAKGLNLAIHDAECLAQTFINYFTNGDTTSLANYSRIRLPQIWAAQEFSFSMLEMLHRSSNSAEDPPFIQKLKQSKIAQLEHCDSFAKDFASKYLGAL